MAVSFEKIGDLTVTFYGNASVGDVVTISSSNTVAKAADGNAIAGICVAKDGDICTVQIKGFMNFKYTGTAVGVGRQIIVGAGDNEVKLGNIATNGTSILVVNTDATSKEFTALI